MHTHSVGERWLDSAPGAQLEQMRDGAKTGEEKAPGELWVVTAGWTNESAVAKRSLFHVFASTLCTCTQFAHLLLTTTPSPGVLGTHPVRTALL